MDTLANVGRTLATPKFLITVIISALMLGGGIYLATRNNPIIPMSQTIDSIMVKAQHGMGYLFIAFSVLSVALAWIYRKAVHSNNEFAALVGFSDVANTVVSVFK